MKLATLKNGTRDGALFVVSRDLSRACAAGAIARTMQAALDEWDQTSPQLQSTYERLNAGSVEGAVAFDARQAMAPLPRAYQWMDGSVYVNHFELMQSAFDNATKLTFQKEPMVYQGGSDDMLGAHDDIEANDEAHGIDFEAEVVVITGDVPVGTRASEAVGLVRLVAVANDVSLRNLIPHELGKGFGFYQSKPATAFSPVAVTPDELGDAWQGGLVHLPMLIEWNGQAFGRPNAGIGAGFTFFDLIAHAAVTRRLVAGSIVGSGTISNAGPDVGSACIAERRAMERIRDGKPSTPYLAFGDHVRIEMKDASGASVFGAIDQRVVRRAGRT